MVKSVDTRDFKSIHKVWFPLVYYFDEVKKMRIENRLTQDEIIEIAKKSSSYRDFYIKLGYSPNSGSYKDVIIKLVSKYNIDISHFTGSAWNKDIVRKDEIFKVGCKVKSEVLKRALIKTRGYKCECCGLTEWLGKPIPLENHHVDGDPLNNLEDNLKLLCPNCHSLTPNFRNKKRAVE